MSEDKVGWTLDLIEKLQKNGIGDLQKFYAIRSYLEKDGKLTDNDREYLKEKYKELQLKLNTESNVKNETNQNDVTRDNTFTNDNKPTSTSEDDSSLQILKDRLAKGEITVEEFSTDLSSLTNAGDEIGYPITPQNENDSNKSDQKTIKTQNKIVYRGINQYKSEGTTLVLSLFIGFFGFMGIGHLYQGHIAKSLALLYGGWVLLIFNIGIIISFIPSTNSYGNQFFYIYMQVFQNLFKVDPSTAAGFTLIIMFGIPLGYLALLIWQIFDARRLCRKYNQHMDETGKQLLILTRVKKLIFSLIALAPIIAALLYFLVILIQ